MAYTTIDDPSAYFHTQLYTGDGQSSKAITNDANAGDFQPDFLWIKERSSTSAHLLFDSTRGTDKKVNSNTPNDAEETYAYLSSYDADGFTIGTSDGAINQSSQTYAAWQWKANGASTTSNGASGDIKASVTQREDTAKFSICTYTGTGISAGQSHRVNHGLGTTPHVMLFKCRGVSGDWVVYHHKNTSAPETDYLVLNAQDATADNVDKFADTAPGVSYATIGGDDNISSNTMLLYSFAEVQGYSKFGSYEGNADADGTFVYTGFKPAWVMIKRTDDSSNWHILDNKRDTRNEADATLVANASGAEFESSNDVDFLSNGFKLRANETSTNNGTYIYMSFAEQPFVTSGGVPCTAR